MKFNPKALPITSKALFTIVGGAVLINPVFAQEQASEELEEVVVTGLRGSLKASMETKRDAIGVVDAINAEDIGKFPDTNLAEALQRITGDLDRPSQRRRRAGHGARLRPAVQHGDPERPPDAVGRRVRRRRRDHRRRGSATRVRSTSRISRLKRSARSRCTRPAARTSPPAVSAPSINIRTARPLDSDGLVLNVGVKAVNDTTNRVGDDITPEVSGIFSYANRQQDVRRRPDGQLPEARQRFVDVDGQRLAHPGVGRRPTWRTTIARGPLFHDTP